ncbi:hypothetical protein CAK95_11670 [Pseudorhodoplanes sinuspersici]|uniref:Uncharacterized protein n=1 Tax=Pseudorhodoplanes sinuspersici TaxID=1235591 RepID=A0A1W6ZRC3_9HYPH|nr:hypothetical protein CAK95_11670 [Pseudorhodoplanes sinuspersici]
MLFAGLLVLFFLILPFISRLEASSWSFYGVALGLAIVCLPFIKSLHAEKKKINELASATAMAPICLHDSVRLLVLRSIDDEASLTLAAGAIGTRLARVTFLILSRLLIFYNLALIFTCVVLVGFFLASDLMGANEGARALFYYVFDFFGLEEILPKVLGFMIGIPITCLILLGVAGLFKCVYGRELAVGTSGCEINSQSVPDKIASDLSVITLSDGVGPRRLRHMIYDNHQSAVVIAEWLDRQAAKLRIRFEAEIVSLIRSRSHARREAINAHSMEREAGCAGL